MKSPDFVHLHTHSEYSLLDGFAPLDKLLASAAQQGMEALALTDHGNLYGAVRFTQKAAEYGLKPIIGCEVYVAPDSRFDRTPGEARKSYHLVLLAENTTGYRNLVSLVSRAHLEGFYYRPRVDKELLSQKSAGLIALSGCLAGEIPSLLLQNDYLGAKAAAQFYQQIFGSDSFYLELQDHGLIEEKQVNAGLLQLAHELQLPLVATNDVHYLTQSAAIGQDCLLCIGTGTKLSDPDRMRFPNDQFYLKSAAEMAQLFAQVPEAISNTVAIAERCQFQLELGGMYLPVYPVPAELSADAYLRQLAEAGVHQRYGATPAQAVWDRLERELEIIGKLGYSDYFLIVWDFIRYAVEQGIPVGPGRGSAAGSLVAYALRITGIDPIKYGLLFERFLNPERVTMPDIDIDFDYERRNQVIDYVRQKYGSDRVAQIITFGTLQARAAIRDVGRVLDWPIPRVDSLAKLVPNELGITINEALQKEPRLAQAYQSDAAVKKLLDLAQAVEGLPRHASTHAAGVVIGAGPLEELVPLQQGSEAGTVTTQFDMGSLEAVGLLKMDFLGLRTLTVINDTVQMIKETTGQTLDLAAMETADPEVYTMLAQGDAQGVFQMESRLFHRLLIQVKPSCFEDLIALVSLGRPGPMNMVPDFAARKHGAAPVEYLHPALEPILKETYGIMVYQEQVMQIASELAGFSLGEADLLRRAMGKKKLEVLLSMKERFLQGCAANGVQPAVATEIFEAMEYFANYGFNKSHAAAYALLAYWTAYLRCHYPTQFFAAILTSVRGNPAKIKSYVFTAQTQLGIEVYPPDVNRSKLYFSVEELAIRFGLSAIKNVGESTAEAIIQERTQNGPYTSLIDLCRRLPGRILNKLALEYLIKAGACDSLGPRHLLLDQFEVALDRANQEQSQIARGQVSLFATEVSLPLVSDQSDNNLSFDDLLALEKEALGLYLSGHPMAKWRQLVSEFTQLNLEDLEGFADQEQLLVAGVIGGVRRRLTKKNQPMATLILEDEVGSLDVLVFPSVFRKRGGLVQEGKALVIWGRLDIQEEGMQLIASELIPLEPEHLVAVSREQLATLKSTSTELPRPALLKVTGNDQHIVLIIP